MKTLFLICADEWRQWLRSHLVLACSLLFLILLATAIFLNASHIADARYERMYQQQEAEETFLSQPDRHPHRMVHYGHYVFRTPPPLAIVDPGLDPVTGQSIFLEGHRQNSAMFAESGAGADLGGLSFLTPAMLYQFFAPLLIVLLGHGAVTREREARVLIPMLAFGLTGRRLVLGKFLALFFYILVLLLPLLISCGIALGSGEKVMAVASLVGSYCLYLCIWALMSLVVSSVMRRRASVLVTLTALWLCITLVLPSMAANLASRQVPLPGKIKTDLAMLTDLRKLGDGHNAQDPAFTKLREDILAKYEVEAVEDLPVNFRGLVALTAEEKLTDVLNKYANQRMALEADQAKNIERFGWLTPALAITDASRAVAGTDLYHYHRFLREAEALRLDFVQGLNRAHLEKLSYEDDINRNKDEASWMRARVDASNWQVLEAFEFKVSSVDERISNAASSFTVLIIWCASLFFALFWFSGRLKP